LYLGYNSDASLGSPRTTILNLMNSLNRQLAAVVVLVHTGRGQRRQRPLRDHQDHRHFGLDLRLGNR